MCSLVDWHISQLAETRTVWNARWGLLSALLHRYICSSRGSATRHSFDRCLLALPMWSFSLGQNKHFHSTAWIGKKKTAFVSYVGNGDGRKEATSVLPSAQLSCITPLPEASAVLLTTGQQHSSPGLLPPVTTRLCFSYGLEIKMQFNMWHFLSFQYIFSSWALIAARHKGYGSTWHISDTHHGTT